MPTVELSDHELAELKQLTNQRESSAAVQKAIKDFVGRTHSQDELAAEFAELVETWKRETQYLSKVSKKSVHPAYQSIIGMGKPAVPLLLSELNTDPADWFWALTALTGENPIPAEAEGDVAKMTAFWLSWGRAKGYDV